MVKVGQMVKFVEEARFAEEQAKAELEAASMAGEVAPPAPRVRVHGAPMASTESTRKADSVKVLKA